MKTHFTLWLPGLRPDKKLASELGRLPQQEQPQLKNLNLLLSRADRVLATDIVQHDFILDQLAEHDVQCDLWPMAKWRLAIEEFEAALESQQWICADPVYLHPDRSAALLHAHQELEIKLEEAQAIAELINHYYKDEPWRLHVGSSHRWYIELDKTIDLITHALQLVKGKNIFDYFPEGKDSGYWQQRINEIQMLLHASETNQQREEQGMLPINSLWLWGYAATATNENLPWQHVYTNDAVVNGLALLGGSNVKNLPSSVNDVKDMQGDVLIYSDELSSLLNQQDVYAWLSELQHLEDDWFSPLLNRLNNSSDMQITLLTNNNEAYILKSKYLKRWWRRNNKNNLF